MSGSQNPKACNNLLVLRIPNLASTFGFSEPHSLLQPLVTLNNLLVIIAPQVPSPFTCTLVQYPLAPHLRAPIEMSGGLGLDGACNAAWPILLNPLSSLPPYHGHVTHGDG